MVKYKVYAHHKWPGIPEIVCSWKNIMDYKISTCIPLMFCKNCQLQWSFTVSTLRHYNIHCQNPLYFFVWMFVLFVTGGKSVDFRDDIEAKLAEMNLGKAEENGTESEEHVKPSKKVLHVYII